MRFEENRVSIVKHESVSIAYPTGMDRLSLGLVLHGLAGVLIRGEVEKHGPSSGNGNGNGNGIVVDTGRYADLEITPVKEDKRGMPRRKVKNRRKVRGGSVEELECGHEVRLNTSQKKHKSRSCTQCAEELAKS